MQSANFTKQIILPAPIAHVDIGSKRYYLTANIFYQGVHFAVRKRIIDMAKRYLGLYVHHIPPLQWIEVELIFRAERTNWDLDNKEFFWRKVLMDILKGHVVADDSVKYVRRASSQFIPGPPSLTINITGLLQN